jgi:hypothetical protein
MWYDSFMNETFTLHPTAFWANYGHFHADLRPDYGDRPPRMRAFAIAYGDPSLRPAFRTLRRRTVIDKVCLGSSIWGSAENEIVGWTIATPHQTKLLAGSLTANVYEHSRLPVLHAWKECVRLVKQNLAAELHAEDQSYRGADWTKAREEAVATLASLNRKHPPLVEYLPCEDNGMDF